MIQLPSLNSTFAAIVAVNISLLWGLSRLNAEDVPAPQQEAEVKRNVAGTIIGPNGFSDGQLSLEKGKVYDVIGVSGFSDVLISVEGKAVKVRESDVRVFEKVAHDVDQSTGFVPGRIYLSSAYYGPPVERPRPDRQTLRAVQKMLPDGEISKPIEILVTDALSGRASGSQKIRGEMDYYGNIQMEKEKKNVLILEYEFNGEKIKKSAIEETVLVLP